MPVRRVLLLGDVCAEPGRKAVKAALPGLRDSYRPDFVVANAENAAGGYGITPRLAEELLGAGIDCLTTGDHAFERRESWEYYGSEPRLLRPLNYPAGAPGRGDAVFELQTRRAAASGPLEAGRVLTASGFPQPEACPADEQGFRIAVVNLQGRVFMKPLDCPFQRISAVLDRLHQQTRVVVVDFHAEATAEKQAMAWFLDGRVSALLGTHTHVQTADERILPGGTACITDAGMCGSFDSILGMKKEEALIRVMNLLPARLHPAHDHPRVNGVLVDIDQDSGRAVAIRRVDVPAEA